MGKLKNRIKKYLFNKVAPGYMEVELFDHLPKNLNVFMDIGAHSGSFTKMIHSRINTKESFLFEPIPEFFQKISNDSYFKSCHLFNAAVSSSKGMADFYVNELPETSSLLNFDSGLKETKDLNKAAERMITIPTITLSDVINEFKLNEIDFMKIDVQGAEMDVLMGMKNDLNKVNRILTEVSFKPIYKGSATFESVYKFLSDHGFIMTQLIPVYRGTGGELLQCDALFINKKLHE